MERGVPIRSIGRSIAVLQVVNRCRSSSLMQIARLSKLPYPTACRIVQTLMHEGLIECEPTRKFYRATGDVQALSRGFRNDDALVTTGRPFAVALTRKTGWPVVVATRVGESMMVRDSTDDLTALTTQLRSAGCTLSIPGSAPGRVALAHLDDDERRALMARLEPSDDGPHAWPAGDDAFARIRADGYACCDDASCGTDAAKTSSIAVPLHDGGRFVGALAATFLSSVIGLPEALERHLDDLEDTAASIGEALGSMH